MSELSRLIAEAEKADSERFLRLVDQVMDLLSKERNTVRNMEFFGRIVKMPLEGEATIIGDVHGDIDSLHHVLDKSSFIEKAQRDEDVLAIFLGDYGDRGIYSPEVYYVVLSLKSTFPDKVVLLRGNHEGPKDLLAYPHDLPLHLGRKFGDKAAAIYDRLTHLFEYLYLAAIIDKRYVMLHGGVPSEAKGLDDVAFAREKHPTESHLEEILWSDPVENITGARFSPRGAGRLFGRDVTSKFLRLIDAQMIIRGHEPANEGFKLNHEGRVLTLFSRKGRPYYNRQGAYLQLNLSGSLEDARQVRRFLRWI